MTGFAAELPNEPFEVQTLRHVCGRVLESLEISRKWFLRGCDDRLDLCNASQDQRLDHFASLTAVARVAANSSATLPNTAEEFIAGLRLQEPKEARGLSALLMRMRGSTSEIDRNNRIREDVLGHMQYYADFDPEAARAGRPQSEIFMDQLKTDYATLREVSRLMHQPFSLMMNIEGHFGEIIGVYREFERAAFAGRSPEPAVRPNLQDEPACTL